jgi:DNA modification methylase
LNASEREEREIARHKLYLGDCMEIMQDIPDDSIDAVIADLPMDLRFKQSWKQTIPFKQMWVSLERIGRKECSFVLIAKQPQTSFLILSNKRKFRHCWVFEKNVGTIGARSKIEPFQKHEDVCVFGEEKGIYIPQMEDRNDYNFDATSQIVDIPLDDLTKANKGLVYPSSVQRFFNSYAGKDRSLSHEKPLKLMRYLIRTYSKRGGTVLDFCMGGGSTIVAAKNMGRHSIGIEIEREKFERAEARVRNAEQGATDVQNEGHLI